VECVRPDTVEYRLYGQSIGGARFGIGHTPTRRPDQKRIRDGEPETATEMPAKRG
jgi:hypothetical protein